MEPQISPLSPLTEAQRQKRSRDELSINEELNQVKKRFRLEVAHLKSIKSDYELMASMVDMSMHCKKKSMENELARPHNLKGYIWIHPKNGKWSLCDFYHILMKCQQVPGFEGMVPWQAGLQHVTVPKEGRKKSQGYTIAFSGLVQPPLLFAPSEWKTALIRHENFATDTIDIRAIVKPLIALYFNNPAFNVPTDVDTLIPPTKYQVVQLCWILSQLGHSVEVKRMFSRQHTLAVAYGEINRFFQVGVKLNRSLIMMIFDYAAMMPYFP